MPESIGHGVKMSQGRRFVCDLLDAGMRVPLVTIQKDMNVAELAMARKNAEPRPSWCAIFTKAYGKMVAGRPDMRRACLTFPWLRMFEYHTASADVTVEAKLGDETCLAFVRIKRPDLCPLLDIDRRLAWCMADPLERIRKLKGAWKLARLPRFVRRAVWWYLLNVSGQRRARFFGTYGVTSVGNWGVESVKPIAPLTSILQYGAIDPAGKISIRMTYDHRVLDGSGPSMALNEMEHLLKTDLLAEVRGLSATATAA